MTTLHDYEKIKLRISFSRGGTISSATVVLSLLLFYAPLAHADDLRPCTALAEEDTALPYVPVPEHVADKMLKTAGVRDDDVVYALGGCDGRLVVAAAKEYGAGGIGIDNDPERISESRAYAEKENAGDKVEFYRQDIFAADLSGASVLAIYLTPDIVNKLCVKIIREMRRGSRVVSCDFTIEGWEPDAVERTADGHAVYLWTVPANVSGTWRWQTEEGKAEFSAEQRFQKAGGWVVTDSVAVPVRDGVVKGAVITFVADQYRDGAMTAVTFIGTVNGNTIDGQMQWQSRDGKKASGWKARRDPATIISIAGGA